jgi:hypothetical protein
MKNLSILLVLLFSVSLVAKPKGESTVVGCLIVDVAGSYSKEPGPVYNKHDIRIDCEYVNKKGKSKQYTFMTRVDENGYFQLKKVPAGEYVLKAVEFTFERTGRITLASKFGRADFSEESRYWGMLSGMMMDNAVYLQQDQIDVESRDGVIDLGIQYILIEANEQATDSALPQISPDGRPPWQQITVMDRSSIIGIRLVNSSTFEQLQEKKMGLNEIVYNKVSPTAYFELN